MDYVLTKNRVELLDSNIPDEDKMDCAIDLISHLLNPTNRGNKAPAIRTHITKQTRRPATTNPDAAMVKALKAFETCNYGNAMRATGQSELAPITATNAQIIGNLLPRKNRPNQIRWISMYSTREQGNGPLLFRGRDM